MHLHVTGCNACPFANNDNESGIDMCNLAEALGLSVELAHSAYLSRVPDDDPHWRPDNCPLRGGSALVQLADAPGAPWKTEAERRTEAQAAAGVVVLHEGRDLPQ